MQNLRTIILTTLTLAGVSLAGCGFKLPCLEGDDVVTVVLTFDDGPLPADVAEPADAASQDELLDALRRILDLLEEREIRAVFFVAGPGESRDPGALVGVFGEGLGGIRNSGHVLGYHAWRHDPAIWLPHGVPPSAAIRAMSDDLDMLQSYIDGASSDPGFTQGEAFSPLFRQPFGGAVFWTWEGFAVACLRGWTYQGFDIDGHDWIANADVSFDGDDGAGAATEVDLIVTEQLRRSAGRIGQCNRVVDVLFHVNATTATHLGDWIDEIEMAVTESTGRPVVFAVPDSYLARSGLGVRPRFFVADLAGLLIATLD